MKATDESGCLRSLRMHTCLIACLDGAAVYLQMWVHMCIRACIHVYVLLFAFFFSKWPLTMLLQLRADESDVIVCGSMACSREPSELDDYMS